MTAIELKAMISEINNKPPPMEICLLKVVSNVDWIVTSEEEIDICCNILLRISADVIVCASDIHGARRIEYEQWFQTIKENIEKSNIVDQSLEFSEYFDKYKNYMLDFQS